MDRKVIIVSPNTDDVFVRILDASKNVNEERHVKYFLEYIENMGIELEPSIEKVGYRLAIVLVNLGYAILQVDDFSVVYLPEELTDFQYKWLKKQKSSIFRKQFGVEQVGIISVEDSDIICYDKFSLDGVYPSAKFMELLRNKKGCNVKQKEYVKCIKD